MVDYAKEYLSYLNPYSCFAESSENLLAKHCAQASQDEGIEESDKSLERRIAVKDESRLGFVWNHIYWKKPVTILEDTLTIMGACLSGGNGRQLIPDAEGDEKDFHKRFIEDRVLGQGEFGVVNLVHDMEASGGDNAMACKILRKGIVFKDNTLYAPIKPEVLQGEVAMLRTLHGEHFCLGLVAVYETSRSIYLVMEHCAGGEMMEYVSKQEEDLRTDDVSRISFQMLDAVNHCAKHEIIHRDIKPENIMFRDPTPGSDLRIIDFGSGTNRVVEGVHSTFAGSAFYISPEMFQRTYTKKTDVWSVGVTLYVLVAGYPADVLQKAFNLLHTNDRDLRKLPGFPTDVPDSFHDMLSGLLIYRHKARKSAAEMLDHKFVKFHKSALSFDQIALEAQENPSSALLSMSLRGSVSRHTKILIYQKYQRSLTTLLATLLDKKDLAQLMKDLNEKVENKKGQDTEEVPIGASDLPVVQRRLAVIPMNELTQMLRDQDQDQVLMMIDKLPDSNDYNTFAYDINLLREFVRDDEGRDNAATRSVRLTGKKIPMKGSTSLKRTGSFRGSLRGSVFKKKNRSTSVHSQGSLRGRNFGFGSQRSST